MKPRIPYTKPSITELEVRYATDAAADDNVTVVVGEVVEEEDDDDTEAMVVRERKG